MAATHLIAAIGDSITNETPNINCYPAVLQRLLFSEQGIESKLWRRGMNGHSWNYAWPSSGLTNTINQEAAAVLPGLLALPQYAGLTKILIAFAGTNGIALAGHSAATEYSNFQTFIAARLSAGWTAGNIYVCTMLPRGGSVESARGTYNTSLVSGAATYHYIPVRFDQITDMGGAGDNANTDFYKADQIHPNTAGQAALAQKLYDTMYP